MAHSDAASKLELGAPSNLFLVKESLYTSVMGDDAGAQIDANRPTEKFVQRRWHGLWRRLGIVLDFFFLRD